MKSFPELIKEANDQINTVSVEELQSVIEDPKSYTCRCSIKRCG